MAKLGSVKPPNWVVEMRRFEQCQVDGVDRSVERAKRLMRSYARFQGTQTSIRQIVEDMNGGDPNVVEDKTVRNYL